MSKFFTTSVGRLRLLGFLEGISLLLLLFIAVPVKYAMGDDSLTKMIGPVHGALFLLFVLSAIGVGTEQRWRFNNTTWKVVLACFIPFGTFYIDRTILRKIRNDDPMK